MPAPLLSVNLGLLWETLRLHPWAQPKPLVAPGVDHGLAPAASFPHRCRPLGQLEARYAEAPP